MKKTKLISCFAALVLAGTMAVSITACGSDTQTPATSSAASVESTASSVDLTDVNAILANLHQPTNFDLTREREIDTTENGERKNIKTSANIVTNGTERVKASAEITVNDKKSPTVECYMETKDGVTTQYVYNDDSWVSSTMEDSEFQSLFENNGTTYLKNATDLTIEGTETINGAETVVLKGNTEMPSVAKRLESVFDQSITVDPTMSVTFYVRTSDLQIVQMTVDLKSVYEAGIAAQSDADDSATTVNTSTLKITINAIDDEVEDFTIPAEAYEATPAESQTPTPEESQAAE